MEKSRKTNKLILILLLVLIIGLSIGFAAYGRELKITTAATVKGDESGFKVVFSTEEDAATPGTVSAANSYANDISIDADSTELSNLKATFTAPGQTATWTFYSYNDGKFDAFLNGVVLGDISATPKGGTDAEKVTEAVKGISVKVKVGTTEFTTTQDPLSATHKLAQSEGEEVVVTIDYAADSAIADGDFDVTIGDISLKYNSVD